MIKLRDFLFTLICSSTLAPGSLGRNLDDIYRPYQEGPGEGCYSVCLSKEIKKLHEEINEVSGIKINSVLPQVTCKQN